MGSSHKLLKSEYCYFFNIDFPWMKVEDDNAVDVFVTMVSFCVRNFNI